MVRTRNHIANTVKCVPITSSASRSVKFDRPNERIPRNIDNDINNSIRVLWSMRGTVVPKKSIRRSTRKCSEPVRCTDFGEERRIMHPECFFCHNCDCWDQTPPHERVKMKRDSKRFKCTAGHENKIFPSVKKPIHHCMFVKTSRTWKKMIKVNNSGYDSESDCSSTITLASDDSDDSSVEDTMIAPIDVKQETLQDAVIFF